MNNDNVFRFAFFKKGELKVVNVILAEEDTRLPGTQL